MRMSDWSSDVCSSDLSSASNCGRALAMATNSLVHTGVKSPGCENSTSQRPRKSARDTGPVVLRAVKFGTSSPSRKGAHAGRGSGVDIVGSVSVFALSIVIRSEEHTSELQSLMRISYAVFCLKKKNLL